MKMIAVMVLALLMSMSHYAEASARGESSGGGGSSVKGHTKKDGTFVAPHQRSNPNGSKTDNWSTKGNTNPYTGRPGTKKSN